MLLNSFQDFVSPYNIFISLSKNPDFRRSPMSNVAEENQEEPWYRPDVVISDT